MLQGTVAFRRQRNGFDLSSAEGVRLFDGCLPSLKKDDIRLTYFYVGRAYIDKKADRCTDRTNTASIPTANSPPRWKRFFASRACCTTRHWHIVEMCISRLSNRCRTWPNGIASKKIARLAWKTSDCRHTIQPGRLCLSELPEEIPTGVSRSDFKNYCIGCPECWRQGKHACYVRHLDSGRNIGRTPRSLPCARCGRRSGAGEKAGVEIYYDWPNQAAEERSGGLTKYSVPGLAAAAQVGTIIRGIPDGSFANLTHGLQRKFMDAGLRHGTRSTAEAQTLYQESVPSFVRNYGEDSVKQFLQGKDASHIQSVHNHPDLAIDTGNIIWESRVLVLCWLPFAMMDVGSL